MPRRSKQDYFLSLPWVARQATVEAQGLVNRLVRYGSGYRRAMRLYAKTPYQTRAVLADLQRQELRSLLAEAIEHTEYYRDAYSHLSSADLQEAVERLDLSGVPLLKKETLKLHTPRFFNTSRRTVVRSSTSGSTGSPLCVEYDRESVERRFALLHRFRAWGGAAPFGRQVRCSGRELVRSDRETSRAWLVNHAERMLLVSTYHLRAGYIERIGERVREWQPQVIEGYPTAMQQLAAHFEAQGLSLPGLRMIVTTAETLDDTMRAAIQRGFDAQVFDYYAASEGVPFICQCRAGSYHVCLDSGYFEFLTPEGHPARPGDAAEIVVTSFCQAKTPLIRYRTGDMVELLEEGQACECELAFPVVGKILGRVEDQVVTSDGRRIGMFAYRTLKHVPGLKEGQIVQSTPNRFSVRLVPDGSRTLADVEHEIRHVFERVLGYHIELSVESVALIPRGPNGKFRALLREFDG